jgi:uncharacterized protein
MKIAIIGSGISGLLTARLLSSEHDIHVFEANDYAGGHANTVSFDAFDNTYSVDTGFMVFNDHTYPNFLRMLELLKVSARNSDMSFSVHSDLTGLEYQSNSINGVFAQRRNLLRPSFYKMLLEITRFNRKSRELLESDDYELELGEYLQRNGYSRNFIDEYFVPMGASIWSATPERFLHFSAKFIVSFLDNHGLLQVRDHFQWKTVQGGSIRYVQALSRPFADRIRLNCPVLSVERRSDCVAVTSKESQSEEFDAVVMAAHSDQTLNMLTDASDAERKILGDLPYQRNETTLHYDASLMPHIRRAWASWNYRITANTEEPVVLTYDLNRLQGHVSPEPICVTLNGLPSIDEKKTIKNIEYHHPVFTREAIAAQKEWNEINGTNRTYFCGAYWGHGFHEDGVNSALAVAECFGKDLESCTADCIMDASNMDA